MSNFVPLGVEGEGKKVCKLNQVLYALKQAARCWFEVFWKTIREKDFHRWIYILDGKVISKNIHDILYADDVIVTENDDKMQSFETYLKQTFLTIDLKNIKVLLEIR